MCFTERRARRDHFEHRFKTDSQEFLLPFIMSGLTDGHSSHYFFADVIICLLECLNTLKFRENTPKNILLFANI